MSSEKIIGVTIFRMGPRLCFLRFLPGLLLGMSFPIVTRLADVLPVALVVAVQSSQRKSVGPDPAHLFIEVLAKVGYVKNAPAIV